MCRLTFLSAILLIPTWVSALEIALPEGSVLAADQVVEAGAYGVPYAPFKDGVLPVRQINGHVTKQAWHLVGETFTTEQLVSPMRDQLEAAGFDIILDCEANSCGGFDFRFATDVLPAPDMFVDLTNYRFLAAVQEIPLGTEAVTVLVSLSEVQAYTQLIVVQPVPPLEDLPLDAPIATLPLTPAFNAAQAPTDLITTLDQNGHVVLSDLEFETGSSNLATGDFKSLENLANFLLATPATRISLVGHTDNVGSLEGNVALSQRRAQAVKNRLVNSFGVRANQIDARGVGYLSPIASNTTDSGRAANRRVEAVLLGR